MSDYYTMARRHKKEAYRPAVMLDNYFGHHLYGIRFLGENWVSRVDNGYEFDGSEGMASDEYLLALDKGVKGIPKRAKQWLKTDAQKEEDTRQEMIGESTRLLIKELHDRNELVKKTYLAFNTLGWTPIYSVDDRQIIIGWELDAPMNAISMDNAQKLVDYFTKERNVR